MINNIQQDNEALRIKRNLTTSQKKSADLTKEGVVVNNFIKDDSLYDTFMISENSKMPSKLNEDKPIGVKNLFPIAAVSTGVMTGITLMTMLIKRNAKVNLNLPVEKKLPNLTRNLAINEETHQAIYQMVQTPNQKTILAGVGVLTLTAMAFMGKMFIDGFKDIWIKKKEADIQKNLQENLIDVETQSFSGKIQIMRSMLSEKAKEFSPFFDDCQKGVCFKQKTPYSRVSFTNNQKKSPENSEKKSTLQYISIGIGTVGAIVGLSLLAMKNLSKSRQYLEKYINSSKEKIGEIISKSTEKTKATDKTNLKNMLQAIDATPQFIKKELNKLPWQKAEKEDFIEQILFETKKSTAQADKAIGGDGTPKPAFYSHVNDYRAFFYNWLLDTSNPLFRNLFLGVTGVSAFSYGGKVMGEAIKDVQVKKTNADTELKLQKRLVSTELRNFKTKKDSAVQPLVKEFYNQVDNGKPKSELKVMAENILSEIKNGPPFIYS